MVYSGESSTHIQENRTLAKTKERLEVSLKKAQEGFIGRTLQVQLPLASPLLSPTMYKVFLLKTP